MRILTLIMMFCLLPVEALAAEADVLTVEVSKQADNRYQFRVTVQHADEGWDHYANRWEVVGPDGEVLATRVLLHPHVNEQPFTRSLSAVDIPAGISEVRVRATDSVHGYGGQEYTLSLP
ncbi:MAG: hypothetical protein V7731_08600 [Amphritea sp.]